MPKKKKKKLSGVVANSAQGEARRFVNEHFGQMPVLASQLKNGHILHQYFVCDSIVSETLRTLAEKFTSVFLLHRLRSVVLRTEKFKNIPRDKHRFSNFCNEHFAVVVPEVQDGGIPEHSAEPSMEHLVQDGGIVEQSVEQVLPDAELLSGPEVQDGGIPMHSETSVSSKQSVPQTPRTPKSSQQSTPSSMNLVPDSVSTRSLERKGILSPHKKKMIKRLEFVSKRRSDMKNKYLKTVKNLREKLKDQKFRSLKYANQEVKRCKLQIAKKDAKMVQLQAKYSKSALSIELQKTKEDLSNLYKKYARLKRLNRASRFNKAPIIDQAANEIIVQLQDEIKKKDETISYVEYEKVCLADTIDDIMHPESNLKKDGKQYPTEMRMIVYEAIVNNVPTSNIPSLVSGIAKRFGIDIANVPQRSTVEMMCRELGAIADFQTAEHMLENKNSTLGFDATTQEGVHVNSVHVTSAEKCNVVAVDPLAGGTAEDYANHVNESLDNLAEVYTTFYKDEVEKSEFPKVRSDLVDSISNSITDRASVNHAAINRLENSWGKKLNELKCHVHPLESIASGCRKAIGENEPSGVERKVKGSECFASGLVLGFNKFRYKDATGDPKNFVRALKNHKLPCGLLPRYRGNRLHIMFLICGRLYIHLDFFRKFLKEGTASCNKLKQALEQDLSNPIAIVEIQVLGLLGKLLTGPWMAKFYQGAGADISHVQGIRIVKEVLARVEVLQEDPCLTLSATHDCFGAELPATPDIKTLQNDPSDNDLFGIMMKACLNTVSSVLRRQYEHYFNMELTEQMRQETASARLHNIDAEQVMGMFSSMQEKAPNATLCFISCKIRAQKNKVMQYLDGANPKKKEKLVKMAVSVAKKQRRNRRKKLAEMEETMQKRLAAKKQARDEGNRKKLEKKIMKEGKVDYLDFPDVDDESMKQTAEDILGGKIVGRNICHVWFDEETKEDTVYSGHVDKFLKKKNGTYVIGYWQDGETYEDNATDFEISKFQLVVDYLLNNLTLA